MIQVAISEKLEGTSGIRSIKVTFLKIPIFSYRITTTNNVIVQQLTPAPIPKQIIGFTNETEDKDKKN